MLIFIFPCILPIKLFLHCLNCLLLWNVVYVNAFDPWKYYLNVQLYTSLFFWVINLRLSSFVLAINMEWCLYLLSTPHTLSFLQLTWTIAKIPSMLFYFLKHIWIFTIFRSDFSLWSHSFPTHVFQWQYTTLFILLLVFPPKILEIMKESTCLMLLSPRRCLVHELLKT